MGKSELENIKSHLKIRLHDCKGVSVISIILGFLFVMDLISLFTNVSKNKIEADLLSLTVYSNWALLFIIIACIFYTIQFNEYNENHQIFPHTATSQLLSFELYCFLINIITQTLALGFYLIQSLVCHVLVQLKGNIKLVYPFNLSFVFTGYIVTMLYGFLLISCIIFLSSLIRKLQWWMLVFYIGIILIIWLNKDVNILGSLFNFYIKEGSLPLFFMKAIITWLVLEVLNFSINQHINIIKVERFRYPQIIISATVLVTFSAFVFMYFSWINSVVQTASSRMEMNMVDLTKDKPACTLDASSLPDEANINVFYKNEMQDHTATNVCEIDSEDDNISIYYSPMQEYNNSINLNAYINPRIEASLKDDKLNLTLICDQNIKIISLYPYSTLMQFNCYKNKSLAKQYTGGSYGSTPGDIEIVLPKKKRFLLNGYDSETPNYSIQYNSGVY